MIQGFRGVGVPGKHPGYFNGPAFSGHLGNGRGFPIPPNDEMLVGLCGDHGLVGYEDHLASPGKFPELEARKEGGSPPEPGLDLVEDQRPGKLSVREGNLQGKKDAAEFPS